MRAITDGTAQDFETEIETIQSVPSGKFLSGLFSLQFIFSKSYAWIHDGYAWGRRQ